MNFVADAWLPGCAVMGWGAEDHRGRKERKPQGRSRRSGARAAPRGQGGSRRPRTRGRGPGTHYLPVEQGVVVHSCGGGVVWRRGQRQQRQPAGQPREQRGGRGLGRGKQPWRGRDPGSQPEQPGRAGDHPNPGRLRRRRRRVCVHRPEERLPPPRLLRLLQLPPPPLEPGAHQHPTSPRGRRLRARRGRRAPEARAGGGAGSGANSLGSAARPHAPPLPRAGSPSSSSSASAAARAGAAAAPQARPRLAASPGSGLRPALTPGPPRRRGWGRGAGGGAGLPRIAPGAQVRPLEAAGCRGRSARRGRRTRPGRETGSTSSGEAKVAAPEPGTSSRRAVLGAPTGIARGPLNAWRNLGRGRRVPRGCCLQPPTPGGHGLPLGTGRFLSLENLPNTFLRPQRVLCPGGPYPTLY